MHTKDNKSSQQSPQKDVKDGNEREKEMKPERLHFMIAAQSKGRGWGARCACWRRWNAP